MLVHQRVPPIRCGASEKSEAQTVGISRGVELMVSFHFRFRQRILSHVMGSLCDMTKNIGFKMGFTLWLCQNSY